MSDPILPASRYDIVPADPYADTTLSEPGDPDAIGQGAVSPPGASAGSGYISDAELMAWMQQKSTDQYNKVRAMMHQSDARSGVVEQLSYLKSTLADAGNDPRAAIDQLNALEQSYAGTEFEKTVNEAVEPLKAQLVKLEQQIESVPQALADVPDSVRAEQIAQTQSQMRASFKPSTDSIDTAVEALGHDDSLALTQIQAAMAEIRETVQLTSNIMADQHQALQAIIANYGR